MPDQPISAEVTADDLELNALHAAADVFFKRDHGTQGHTPTATNGHNAAVGPCTVCYREAQRVVIAYLAALCPLRAEPECPACALPRHHVGPCRG